MKITPLEIRQKTFEKNFRGYEKEEVTAFLTLLAQEWEKLTDDKKELQMRLEQSEKESLKLREVEESLFKTLKTAEDTGASIIEQANKTAELILKEAQMNAEAIEIDSKNNAKSIMESADSQARNILEDLKEDVAALIESYETLLTHREQLVKNIKKLAADITTDVNNSQEEFKKIDINAHVKTLKELNRQGSYAAVSERAFKDIKQTIVTQIHEEKEEVVEEKEDAVGIHEEENPAPDQNEETKVEKQEKKPKQNQSGSFFDEFD